MSGPKLVRMTEADPKERAQTNRGEIIRLTLRRTAITHPAQAGVDRPTVKRISGHKTLIMLGRYAHANGEQIRAVMDTLDERYKKPDRLGVRPMRRSRQPTIKIGRGLEQA